MRTNARRADAGVTLVEVLVVLALVGTMSGIVGLALGRTTRGAVPQEEAELLAARMRRASEEALLTSQAVALLWSEDNYQFLALGPEGWGPHPVPILAEVKALGGAVRLLDEAGRSGFVVTGEVLPEDGAPLTLRLMAEGADPQQFVMVTWDGATATLMEPEI